MATTKVALVDGRRTPFCKSDGVLAGAPPHELARAALAGCLEAQDLDPASVGAVVAGCVGATVDAPNVGRQAALEAGLPKGVPGHTVNQACASGLRAVTDAVQMIERGDVSSALAVGTESMSAYPLLFGEGFKKALMGAMKQKSVVGKVKAIASLRPADLKPVIALKEGLEDQYVGQNMGQTAESMAKIYALTREAQDDYALQSHLRTAAAWEAGRFQDEVVAVCPPPSFSKVVRMDAGFRAKQTHEALAKLKPAFDRRGGTVTAGNACMLTDGAAAVTLMPEDAARAEGREPLAVVKDWTYVGLEPGFEGLMGPAYALPKLLEKNGLALDDVDLFEVNEAFASVVLSTQVALESEGWCQENLGRGRVGALDLDKVNVNGGAIAVGHPLGATGVRMLLTLSKEMQRRGAALGVATLCVHGGLGAAVLLERA